MQFALEGEASYYDVDIKKHRSCQRGAEPPGLRAARRSVVGEYLNRSISPISLAVA